MSEKGPVKDILCEMIKAWRIVMSLVVVSCFTSRAYSQMAGGTDNGLDSLNLDLPLNIDFGLNFKPEMADDATVPKFLGIEHFSQSYIGDGNERRLTLNPYHCFIKYNEDPIKWQTMRTMMSLPKVVKQDVYRPFTIGSFGTATSGGAGFIITFSMEDVLQTIFSKTYRYKKHNMKNANAWKSY